MPGEGKRRRTPEILILITAVAAACLSAAAFLCKPDRPSFTVLLALAALCTLVSVNLIIFSSGAGAVRIVLMALMLCLLIVLLAYVFYYLFTREDQRETSAEDSDHSDSDMHIAPSEKDYSVEKLHNAAGYGGGYETNVSKNASHTSEDISELTEISDPATPVDSETISFMETEITDFPADSGSESADENEAIDSNEQKTDAYAGVSEPDTADEVTPAIVSHEDDEDETLPDHSVETAFASIPPVPVILHSSVIIDDSSGSAMEEETVNTTYSSISSSSGTASGMFTGLSPEEADFWASFYIAGQDDLALEDGYYYMDLYINGNHTGTIEVLIEDGLSSLNSRELHSYINGNVIESLSDMIFSSGDAYIPLSDLEELGVSCESDNSNFEIRLTFSTSDMPVQILSVRGTSRHSVFRPIAGGMWLDPAVFVLRSNYSLTARLSHLQEFDPYDSMRFSLTSTNTGRLLDLNFNFSWYMNFGADYFDFNLGSYNFYTDFEDAMVRLSFGNVSPDVLYPSGRSIGIRFDRSYAYGPSDAVRGSQTETMLVAEKQSEVTIYNEGREIFRRTLDPGRYRLQDFILYTGANEILIRVEPLDGSPAQESVMTVNYSSSLIAPGDFYFGASLVTGRETVYGKNGREGVLRIPAGDGQYYEYDWRNITASFYLRTGLTESMSISTAVGLQNVPDEEYAWNPRMKLNSELTHANILGTTRYTFNIDEEYGNNRRFGMPGIYARIGHQTSTGWTPLSSISFSFTYSNPQEIGRENGHRLSVSAGISGRLGILSWSSSFSGTMYTDRMNELSWSQSNSLNLNLSRNFWMSGSLMFNGNAQDTNVYGRIYATIRFDGGSVSASSSMDSMSASASYLKGNHALSSSFSMNSFSSDVSDYSIGAGYSYSGDYFNFGASMSSDVLFRNTNLQLSLSTSSVFADGLFAFGSSIPSNFLMIRQKGALKGNELTLGSPGTSSAVDLDSTFGTYMYTGLSTTRGSAFSLYSNGSDSFANSSVFDINIPENDRYGYVLRIDADETYSVAGYARVNDVIWANGSSPVYLYSVDDNGNAVLTATEIYVFSDKDGLFVLSGLEEENYAFDMNIGGEWYLAVFTVDAGVPSGSVQLLTTTGDNTGVNLPDVYSGSVSFTLQDVLSSDDFWTMIYPDMEVAA